MPSRIGFILGTVLICAVFMGAGQENQTAPKHVTYDRDVAPILYKNCVVCHRENNIAPMSLMTYKDARLWAPAIREAVVQRKMPPWHADPKIGDFINDPRLTEEDIKTIDAWVRTGTRKVTPRIYLRLRYFRSAGTSSQTSYLRFPNSP